MEKDLSFIGTITKAIILIIEIVWAWISFWARFCNIEKLRWRSTFRRLSVGSYQTPFVGASNLQKRDSYKSLYLILIIGIKSLSHNLLYNSTNVLFSLIRTRVLMISLNLNCCMSYLECLFQYRIYLLQNQL